MYELTIGDQRYIEESTIPWRMYINSILFPMKDVPAETTDAITAIEKQYTDDFYVFFEQKKAEDESLHADEIREAFDTVWGKEHPEFYDMDKLFSGCGEEDLKKAAAAIEDAKTAFADMISE